ncbi:MAG: Spy/CpxP family protein refolding chaperone [Deltaproteobacteria bacterium]|nr:Spy/CpxP family protein refolding chaperone [Deltaproteobacteria bacterium]
MILFVFIGANYSYACEMMGGGKGMMKGEMAGMGHNPWFHHGVSLTLENAEKLGLDEKQKNELTGIRDKYTKEIIRLDAESKIAEMDLNKLLGEGDIDLSNVKDAIKKAEDLQSQIRYLRVEAFTEARKILTDEQKGKLKKLMETPSMPMKKEGMKGGMMEGMDCPMMGEMKGGMKQGMMEGGMMGGMGKEKGKKTAAGKETKVEKSSMTQEKKAGEVTVIATLKNPDSLGKKDDLVFNIIFDTHSVNLDTFKFNEGIILKDDKGKTYKPASVKETGSGHHREADVKFKNPGKVKSIEIIVKDLAGVKETLFKWEFSEGMKM